MTATPVDGATQIGYAPLNTLKPVAPWIWVIDGPPVHHMGLPFSTRATVVRLANGDLWVHSPTQLTDALREELDATGPVRHLIAPNGRHYTHMANWQAAYPQARAWAAPGVAARAAENGIALQFDDDLGPAAPPDWDGHINQIIVGEPDQHSEAVFFHCGSHTLILTDLIQNFETAKLPAWMRPVIWLAGIDDTDGKMPPDLKWRFRNSREQLADAVDQMIDWRPRRIILAHGRWYENNAVDELERAFRKLMRHRRWEKVMAEMDADRENR